MEWSEFWELVDANRPARGGVAAHADALTAALVDAGVEITVGFGHRFDEVMDTLDHWDVWGVAYLMLGGCSDDGFEYFRAWVVGQGRAEVEKVSADPQAWLVELLGSAEDDEEDPWEVLAEREAGEGEPLLYAAGVAHEQLTGSWLPSHPDRQAGTGSFVGARPRGGEWEEDELSARFPRLTEMLPDLPTDTSAFAFGREVLVVGEEDLGELSDQIASVQRAMVSAEEAFLDGDPATTVERLRAVLDDPARWTLANEVLGAETATTMAYQGGIGSLQCGDPDRAAAWLGLVADRLDEAPHVRRALAQVQVYRGELDAAEALLDTDEGAAPFDLALAALVAGYRSDGETTLRRSSAAVAAMDASAAELHPWDLAGMHVLVGQALVESGERDRARQSAQRVAELLVDAPPTLPLVPQSHTLTAAVARLDGDAARSESLLEAVWGMVEPDTDDLATAEREKARCRRALGDEAGAQEWYARAAATFGRAGHLFLAQATVDEARAEQSR